MQFRYFAAKVRTLSGGPLDNFVAITDPGTPLEELATEQRLWRCFLNPPDVGGRYSALSYVGLVPAAIIGVDIRLLLDSARRLDLKAGLGLGAALRADRRVGYRIVPLAHLRGLRDQRPPAPERRVGRSEAA